MKALIAFWKKDFINKLIVLISLVLVAGVVSVGVVGYMVLGDGTLPSLSSLMPSKATPTFDFFTYLTPITATTSPYTATPRPTIALTKPETPTIPPEEQLATPTVDTTAEAASAATIAAAVGVSTSSGSVVASPTVALPTSPVAGSPTPTLKVTTVAATATSGSVPGTTPFACIPGNKAKTGRVVEVLDANTMRILIDGPTYVVRYIGVAAPDTLAFVDLARIKNQELLYGKDVTLIPGLMEKDDRGRLLFYVLVGDKFANLEIIQMGFGKALDTPPNNDCLAMFQQAQQSAQSAGVGMWAPPTATSTPKP
jgi:endonuclease YncB( thermonuclease family)